MDQQCEKEIAALQDELRPLQLKYEAEKARLDEKQRLQNKVTNHTMPTRPSPPWMLSEGCRHEGA
jgi:hypothetical protein